ncbi:hypothetical protein EVAR_44305_1 [Eumeta japonica]|uniref:Uncharacterized protein n=1 Tax=Eumeta variegata TaxID=151549 RepID=A0A4C1WT72_EUMVA|nr:hypothetical protein EVAR_44305_1 [Eumeta japonica]
MDKVYSTYNTYADSAGPVYSYCPISTQANENTQISASEINEIKPVFSGNQTEDEKRETNGHGSSDKTDMQSLHSSNAANQIIPRIVQVYQTTVTNSIKIQNSQIIQLLPTPQTQENIVYKQTLQQSLPQFSNVQVISQALQPQHVIEPSSEQLAEHVLPTSQSSQSQIITSDQSFQPQQIIHTATNSSQQNFQQDQTTQSGSPVQSLSQQTPHQDQSEQSLIHIGDVQQQNQPSFQLTQHLLVPRFYKQQMDAFQAQPYYEYQTGVFQKNPAHIVITKIEPDMRVASTNPLE